METYIHILGFSVIPTVYCEGCFEIYLGHKSSAMSREMNIFKQGHVKELHSSFS